MCWDCGDDYCPGPCRDPYPPEDEDNEILSLAGTPDGSAMARESPDDLGDWPDIELGGEEGGE